MRKDGEMAEGLVLSDDQMQESKSILGRIAKSLDAAVLQAVPSCEWVPSKVLLMKRRVDGVALEIATVQPVYTVEGQPSEWAALPDPAMQFTVGAYADIRMEADGKVTAHSLWYSDAHGSFQWCEFTFKPTPASPLRVARKPDKEAYYALSKMGANNLGPMQAMSIHDGQAKGGKNALDPINEQEFVERWANLFKDAVRRAKG